MWHKFKIRGVPTLNMTLSHRVTITSINKTSMSHTKTRHKIPWIIAKWTLEARCSLIGQQGATEAQHVNRELSSPEKNRVSCLFPNKAQSHESPVCVKDVDSILLPEIQRARMHTELCWAALVRQRLSWPSLRGGSRLLEWHLCWTERVRSTSVVSVCECVTLTHTQMDR